MKEIGILLLCLILINDIICNPCADQPSGIFVDNIESCSGYFFCENGNAFAGDCPIPFYFNAKTSRCDFTYNVDCNGSLTVGTTIAPSTDSAIVTTEMHIDPQCIDVPNLSFVNHETDCTKYYTCNYGTAVLQQCPENFFFDFAGQGCNWPELSNCLIDSISCAEKLDGTMFADKYSCTHYYVCFNSVHFRMMCPPGFYFDVDRLGCDYPENVICNK